jgi:DNA polymerase
MRNLQQLKLLKDLYKLKSFGYEYFNDIKTPDINENQLSLDAQTIDQLNSTVVQCNLCTLAKSRKNVVFGEGNIKASVMFIGEGPGAVEDETGRVFVGKAGQLLTKIIETTLNLKREDVYIANIVKCRPPNNRVPSPDEVKECIPFLLKQIEIIKPKIIVGLGATSYMYLTSDTTSNISKIRGEFIDFAGAKLMPTFHPSYLLRNPSAKRLVFNDMLKVKAQL